MPEPFVFRSFIGTKQIDSFRKVFVKEIRKVRQGKEFNWSKIIDVIRELTQSRCNFFVCDSFTKIAYDLLDDYDCRDPKIIAGVVAFRFKLFAGPDVLAGWKYACEEIRHLMTVPYPEAAPSHYNPVFSEVYRGDTAALGRLLHYGITCRPTFDYGCEWLNCMRKLQNYLGPTIVVDYENHHAFLCANKRRLTIVLKAILIMIRQLRINHTMPSEDSVQCWKMVFDTIPERHISRGEVEALLRRIVVPSEESSAVIRYLCDSFEFMFPTSRRTLRPRSLLHLARCQIRQSLREAETVWYGVQYLPLPHFLKEYILVKK